MFSISYPADEHYKSAALENAVQVIAAKRRLVNLYAFNSSNATVYLVVNDSADAGATSGGQTVYPVFAGSFISVATHGGDRHEKGIYLKAFTDTGLGTPAGSVLWYKVDWTAYL